MKKALLGLLLTIVLILWVVNGGHDDSPVISFADSGSNENVALVNEWPELEPGLSLNPSGVDAEQEAPISRTVVVLDEVKPAIAMLDAVEERDLDKLRSLFLPSVHSQIERRGWVSCADELERVIMAKLGSLDSADYSFSFQGDSEKGVVLFTPSSDIPPGKLNVVRVGSTWFLDKWS